MAWDEIDDDIRGTHFNLHNVPDRIAKQRKDPWKDYWTVEAGADQGDAQENGDQDRWADIPSKWGLTPLFLDAVFDAGARLLGCLAATRTPTSSDSL